MINIVVAMDQNRLIGTDQTKNHLPWHNAEDFRHFRTLTTGKTILMGRRTYEAIGRPLPNRTTIVLSKQKELPLPNSVQQAASLSAVIEHFRQQRQDLYICGGANVYKQALPLADRIILSRIPGTYEGNVWFPDFSADYELAEVENRETFQLEIYRRKIHV